MVRPTVYANEWGRCEGNGPACSLGGSGHTRLGIAVHSIVTHKSHKAQCRVADTCCHTSCHAASVPCPRPPSTRGMQGPTGTIGLGCLWVTPSTTQFIAHITLATSTHTSRTFGQPLRRSCSRHGRHTYSLTFHALGWQGDKHVGPLSHLALCVSRLL